MTIVPTDIRHNLIAIIDAPKRGTVIWRPEERRHPTLLLGVLTARDDYNDDAANLYIETFDGEHFYIFVRDAESMDLLHQLDPSPGDYVALRYFGTGKSIYGHTFTQFRMAVERSEANQREAARVEEQMQQSRDKDDLPF